MAVGGKDYSNVAPGGQVWVTIIVHSPSHEYGGTDVINVANLSGLLADDQHVLDAEVLAVASALVHASRHEDAGADEMSLAGLDGESAELAAHKAVKAANAVLGHVIVETASLIDVDVDGKLTLGAHAALHQNGGSDEISVDHGDLAGLADDDHTQYLLADASRALTADWDIGDGRRIEADEIRARDGAGLKLYEDGGAGIFVEDGGNVGIGTTNPGAKLHVSGNAKLSGSLSVGVDTDNVFPILNAGTKSGALYISAEDPSGIGQHGVTLYGSSTGGSAAFGFLQLGRRKDSDNSKAVDVTIDRTGNVGIGTTEPGGKLHVDQAITNAAIPVLYLDQADLSEEFVRFDCTEGVGNAIEDVGGKSLTPTKFIRVNVNGVDLYLQAGTIA